MSDRNTIPDFTADPASMEPALRAIKDIVEQLTGQRASRENTGLRGAPLIYVQGYEPRSGRDGVIRAGTLWINEDTDEAFYWSGKMWKPLLGDVLEIVAAQGESVAELAEESNQEAGEMAFFARNTAPTGWLKANGAAVSRTTYARLFERIGTSFGIGDGSTTFTLPDMRGEFPRGWSDGSQYDSGRVWGTYQGASSVYGASLQPGIGWINGILDGQQEHAVLSNWDGTTADVTVSAPRNAGTVIAAATSVRYGRTVRPRNLALLACIKY